MMYIFYASWHSIREPSDLYSIRIEIGNANNSCSANTYIRPDYDGTLAILVVRTTLVVRSTIVLL